MGKCLRKIVRGTEPLTNFEEQTSSSSIWLQDSCKELSMSEATHWA